MPSVRLKAIRGFLAVVFVVYWLYLAVHAVDIDMAWLLTPARYGGPPQSQDTAAHPEGGALVHHARGERR